MAIEKTDLLLAYRPANKTHYKLSIKDIPQELPDGIATGDVLTWDGTSWNPVQPTDELPVGTEVGQYLRWNGATWEASNTIDGGEYATT